MNTTSWEAADPARLAQGWIPRFVGDRARVTEMTELYGNLGYETLVDPILPDPLAQRAEPCGECPMVLFGLLHLIYTRRRPPAGD